MSHPKILSTTQRKELPGHEEVLMTLDGAKAIIVNATGAAVMDLCDGTRSIGDMASFIVDTFPDAPLTAIVRDVESIVEEFRKAGLLEDTE